MYYCPEGETVEGFRGFRGFLWFLLLTLSLGLLYKE